MKIKLLLLTLFTSSISAQTLNMGTGGESGNYYQMGQDIASYCNTELSPSTVNIMQSGGSISNLVGMQNKQYSLGMVQEDVLFYNAKRDPKKVNRNRLKVLTGLHEESIHLLIPKGYQPKDSKNKSMWSKFFGKKDPSLKFELSMLKGQTVGSWGGSLVSAEALGFFFNLNLKVKEVTDNPNDLSQPIVLVGGAPYKPVQDYLATGKWTLAPLDFRAINQQASFYLPQSINYQIGGKVVSTSTVGVRALLIGKSYRKKSRNEAMSNLATCIYQNAVDLADDPDTNPNWASVYDYIEDDDQSDWSYFPLNESKLANQ
ncbi:TAXI family TRAP transporter solute-binding subunit [Vibrio caribbeanicus]|uniref:TAXI family TRAP transporter solute-binding subunit n=1 Tax=Vibrio caribbeanicus TaxID=701175 RepID=UPI0030D95AA1